MPLYMDVHRNVEGLTPEVVAGAHRRDLDGHDLLLGRRTQQGGGHIPFLSAARQTAHNRGLNRDCSFDFFVACDGVGARTSCQQQIRWMSALLAKGLVMKRFVFVSLLALALLNLQSPRARAAPSPRTVSGTWTVAPSMPSPLMSQQAVLLHDGRVLALGGESVLGVPTSVAQLYDPSTRVWSSETRMHVARIGFTASVLRDGRVLVVGGIGTNMNDLASAEVFDPRTNTWSVLPALPQPRFSQSASLLPDGKVLLVGGIVQQSIARSTVLFDPHLDRFVAGPATHFLHAQQCAMTMPDHRILIAGGYGGDPELYDPTSNSWKPASRTPVRVHPIMTLLPGGSVLLVGGTDRGEHDLRSALVFRPAEDRWTTTGPLHVRRNSGFGALLPDGQVLVAGGEQVDHHLLKEAELYDPAVRAWTPAAPMHVARSGSTSTLLLDGTVLVCGGGSYIGALSSCESFQPSTKGSGRTDRAADARVPAALYPPGTQLTFEPQVSNAEMDFDWGFACDCHPRHIGLPRPRTLALFHLRSQDSLHRTGGWSQLGVSEQSSHFTQFTIYASRYAKVDNQAEVPWSLRAMVDLRLTAWLHGYRPLARPSNLLPVSRRGRSLVMHRRYGSVSALLLAYQNGTQEVEGMVSTNGGRVVHQLMWRDLIQQMRATQTEMP